MSGENTTIWRGTDVANGQLLATATAANRVDFNPTSLETDNGFIFSSEVSYRVSVPENPKVAGNINEVQDMGLDGIDIQLTGLFDKAATNADIDNLVTWLNEDKFILNGSNESFEKGRFGLKMDDLPQFNVVPSNTYGYVLASVKFMRQGEHKQRVGCIITLRFSGDTAGLGT